MPLNLTALETSFDLIAPRGDELVDTFYARLFAAAPAARPLFGQTDLRRQQTMLLGALVLLRKSPSTWTPSCPRRASWEPGTSRTGRTQRTIPSWAKC
jgi:hypothetical protein